MKKTKKTPTPLRVPGTEVALLPGLKPLLVPIDDVHPDPANPRVLKNLEALKGSLRRFGLRRPIIANERDGQIEAGHQTRQALVELGATHIPVIWADDDRIQATAFNIADNKTAEVVADWDEDALTRLLTDIAQAGDLDGMGFDDKEAARLLAGLEEPPEDAASEEDASEAPQEMYRIMIECDDEAHQAELLARFMEEGISCQSLIL